MPHKYTNERQSDHMKIEKNTPEEVRDEERKNDDRHEKAVEGAESADGAGKEGNGQEKGKKKEEAPVPEQAAGEDPSVTDKKAEPDEETDAKAKKPRKERGATRQKKELAKKDEEIASWKDKYARQMAEFDNFRKRTEKEKAVRFDDGAKYILEKLLPVVDNFERGLSAVTEEQKEDPFIVGMEAVYKQMMQTLSDAGVTPIEAKGEVFDPEKHNAVMHIEDDTLGENIVAEELQKGYMYKDDILRYSMVQVAN